MFLLIIYRILGIFSLPIIIIFMLLRLLKKKETINSVLEKFTIKQKKHLKSKVVWIHAVSVGELNIIIPYVKRIVQLEKEISVLVTTTTLTSAKVFMSHNIEGAIHQFLPLDIDFIVKNFLKHWKPESLILVESEMWPNVVYLSSSFCKLFLLNGKLSDRTYQKWNFLPKSFISFMLEKFEIIYPASKLDFKRFKYFHGANLKYIGNFKYSSPPLSHSEENLSILRNSLKNKLVWVAASTHKGEEGIIINAHNALKKKYKNIFTIIIPRHPSRLQEIKHLLANTYYSTDLNKINANDEFLIVAKLGVLGDFYRFSDIVFVGGSLVKIGGHNILEAACLENAIIIGCHTFSCQEVIEEFTEKKAVLIASNQNDLITNLEKLFEDQDLKKTLIHNAKQITNKKSNIIDQVIKSIACNR